MSTSLANASNMPDARNLPLTAYFDRGSGGLFIGERKFFGRRLEKPQAWIIIIEQIKPSARCFRWFQCF